MNNFQSRPLCYCNIPAAQRTTRKAGPNYGRIFSIVHLIWMTQESVKTNFFNSAVWYRQQTTTITIHLRSASSTFTYWCYNWSTTGHCLKRKYSADSSTSQRSTCSGDCEIRIQSKRIEFITDCWLLSIAWRSVPHMTKPRTYRKLCGFFRLKPEQSRYAF